MVTESDIQAFVAAVEAKRVAHYQVRYPHSYQDIVSGRFNHAHVGYSIGKKFARITVPNGNIIDGCVFCFVDMASGDILKADGWTRPAKGSRGHICNGAADVTPYGARYNR